MSRENNGASSGRALISLIFALMLLALCVMVMYPEQLLYKAVSKESVDKVAANENLQIDQNRLGFESFPLYGSESFYGVKNVLEDASPYIKDEQAKVDVWALIKRIPQSEGFLQALYSLALISLISIPVCMLIRFLFYNALFDWIDDMPLLLRWPVRGIGAVGLGVSCTCVSWVFYNTLLFDKLMKKLMEWISSLGSKAAEAASGIPSLLAVNVTNIAAIAVAVVVLIILVKASLFRGSVVVAVFLGFFRSLLFMVVFAFVNVFIGDWTGRVVLFGLIIVLAAGLVERMFDY